MTDFIKAQVYDPTRPAFYTCEALVSITQFIEVTQVIEHVRGSDRG